MPTAPISRRSAPGERFSGDRPTSFDAVNRYDVAVNRWDPLAPLPEARHGLAGAIVGGPLRAIGGSRLAGGMENMGRVDTLIL